MATLQNENHHIHPLPTKISMFCFLSFHGGFQTSNKIYHSLNVSFNVLHQLHLITLFFPYKVIVVINGKEKNQTHNILKLVEVEHTIKRIWVGNFLQPTIWRKKSCPFGWVRQIKDFYFQIYTLGI